MQRVFLNIDAGEYEGEPPLLYELADVINIACGGHAGDDASMRNVVKACMRGGTAIGAHPSFVDREHFGRRALHVEPVLLREQIRQQCARLLDIATEAGAHVTHVKPHGALYHEARRESAVAEAVISGSIDALGNSFTMIGPGSGMLIAKAKAAGIAYAREGFADRAVRADGTLVPRGEPGAVFSDPHEAAAVCRKLLSSANVDTICVHGDTPSAGAIARAVRGVLDEPQGH